MILIRRFIIKTLVVYFTLTGKTRDVAHTIANELQADIEEILPVKPYPKIDLKRISLPALKMFTEAIFHIEPEIKPIEYSINNYDLIIICSPAWANNVAPPLNTFLSQQSFKYKNVSIVITSNQELSSENIFLNIRHRLYSQQATIIQETVIPVVDTKRGECLSATKKLTSRLEPLTKIRNVEFSTRNE